MTLFVIYRDPNEEEVGHSMGYVKDKSRLKIPEWPPYDPIFKKYINIGMSPCFIKLFSTKSNTYLRLR